jgi:uncharacterized protein
MKVVLDANVLVAAYGFGGICRAIVDVHIDLHEIVLSEPILGEVHRNLKDKFHHSTPMADDRVSLLREAATIVAPAAVQPAACRDPDDLPVLGTASSGEANFLVTGDRDLLDLKRFGKCEIVSPREFWRRLK